MADIFDPADLPEGKRAGMDNVITLADVRLSRGWPTGPKCEHRNLVYSPQDRAIKCKSCSAPVEAFDAFMMLVRNFDAMVSSARTAEHKANEALGSVVVRRAAKALDKAWGRKMSPCCPHCNGGLIPADFADGIRSAVGEELEIARRRRMGSRASLTPTPDQAPHHQPEEQP